MSNLDVIRAWKDEGYRLGLTEGQLAVLPANPAGLLQLAADSRADLPFTDVISCGTLCLPTWQSCLSVCPLDG